MNWGRKEVATILHFGPKSIRCISKLFVRVHGQNTKQKKASNTSPPSRSKDARYRPGRPRSPACRTLCPTSGECHCRVIATMNSRTIENDSDWLGFFSSLETMSISLAHWSCLDGSIMLTSRMLNHPLILASFNRRLC